MLNDTLQRVAEKYAKTQSTVVNHFIKSLEFMKRIPWITSTHGLFNQFEEVTNVEGGSFKDLDAPFDAMSADTELKRISMKVMGGEMSVAEDAALAMDNSTADSAAAAARYFAKQTPSVLNKSGQTVEKHFIYSSLYPAMLAYNKKIKSDASKRTMFSAGGTGSTNYSIFAIRQAKEQNCGVVSPLGKNKDEIMSMEWLNGGERHYINHGKDSGKIGYEATWKAYFQYQLACPEYLGGIFNIDPANNHMVTAAMIDDLLDSIEADTSDTILVMARSMASKLGNLKWEKIQLDNEDANISTKILKWNGIPIVGTNTMLKGTEEVTTLPW